MATDEQVELQTLLDDDTPLPPRRPSQPTSSGECAEKQGPAPFSGSDYSQWMTCPNGTFRAVGDTVRQLNPAVYTVGSDNMGLYFSVQPIVTDKLIEIDDSASRRVIRGIQTFWQSRARFAAHGILFKRGVLLWGPPGSGKTVTITFLVRDLLNQGGVVVICSNPELSIAGLKRLRLIEPDRPLIVILEDIEEMIQNHGEHALLGLLDGEHQVANVVHIATTNYPELLGARIVNRPSRFDEVIKVGMPSDRARRTYLEQSLAGRVIVPNLYKWVCDTEGMSIAHLRELVAATQCLGQPYDETLERLKHMKVKPNSERGNGLGFN